MSTPASNPADPILRAALEDAARELVALVEAHRVAGDAELEAALTRVEGVLAATERSEALVCSDELDCSDEVACSEIEAGA
jgi:hypothetical protein